MLLGTGGAKKTYMDDVFSTYLYAGGSGDKTINNGLDMSGEGGMFWSKQRSDSVYGGIWDSVRGASNRLRPDSNIAAATASNIVKSFNNNGVTISSDGGTQIYDSGETHASWSFRKASGFFDIVTWTGNGSGPRSISHALGSVPGLIMVKCTSAGSTDWMVWHRDFGPKDYLVLNSTAAKATNEAKFGGQASGSAAPTSTTFAVGTSNDVNGNGNTYVAYVFAGGESTAATANSTTFTGSIYLQWQTSSSDFTFGTSDFTCEAWVKPTSTNTDLNCIISCGQPFQLYWKQNSFKFYAYDGSNYFVNHLDAGANYPIGQWYHVAVTRSGSTFRLFVNGFLVDTATSSTAFGSLGGVYPSVGRYNSTNQGFAGSISNLRIVKGTALYTSSFRPPTEPLTNITNTKLLCCNSSSSATAYTVSPSTITSSGGVNPSADSPFDDPAAFTFGDSGEEGIIKTGSYKGNGNADGPEINLGWEPQFLIMKRFDSGDSWYMFDNMRGITSGFNSGDDPMLQPNSDTDEGAINRLSLTPTGFKIDSNNGDVNGNGGDYLYIALRRPDGYVGKPYGAGEGASVFAMDAGNGSSTIPTFDSGFPVDFSIVKNPTVDEDWLTSGRLLQFQRHVVNNTNNAASENTTAFDSNVGCWTHISSAMQAFMWKRHAGFDCIAYTGNNVNGRHLRHNLSKPPEMVWFKVITNGSGVNWMAGHKGLNGGTNPWEYYIEPNTNSTQTDYPAWMDTAPTSTHIAVSNVNQTNNTDNKRYIAMLFASVEGVSKCGYYDGSNSTQTITTGFQPRFVIIKSTSEAYPWVVLDTTRGWGSGNDQWLQLNDSSEQQAYDMGAPTSTGFTLTSGSNADYVNTDSAKYIYYAHA